MLSSDNFDDRFQDKSLSAFLDEEPTGDIPPRDCSALDILFRSPTDLPILELCCEAINFIVLPTPHDFLNFILCGIPDSI